MNPKRLWIVLAVGIASALTLTAGYFLFAKFLDDRARAQGFNRPMVRSPQALHDGRQEKVYTAEEIEEARRKGQLPPTATAPNIPQPNAAHNAAVQRSLRTLEEINRLNEMNRRLQEQQQRMQKQ